MAVVGTGASAIGFVPEIAKIAGHVDVYQRSAPYVLPKADRAYRDAEHALYDRLPVVRKADRLRIFLYGELLTSGFVLSPKMLAAPMQLWRRQLRTQIADPELRARCTPDYVLGCKRVAFSNDWYPALARPDVEDAFNAWVQSASRSSVWESGCHNWYLTGSGRNINNWPAQTFMYRYQVRRFDLGTYRVMPAMAGAGAA